MTLGCGSPPGDKDDGSPPPVGSPLTSTAVYSSLGTPSAATLVSVTGAYSSGDADAWLWTETGFSIDSKEGSVTRVTPAKDGAFGVQLDITSSDTASEPELPTALLSGYVTASQGGSAPLLGLVWAQAAPVTGDGCRFLVGSGLSSAEMSGIRVSTASGETLLFSTTQAPAEEDLGFAEAMRWYVSGFLDDGVLGTAENLPGNLGTATGPLAIDGLKPLDYLLYTFVVELGAETALTAATADSKGTASDAYSATFGCVDGETFGAATLGFP